MSCHDIQQQLKSFFEDLLTEEEYQGICYHLDTCAACRQYAASTGSLSYLLKELGELDIPKDLITTIRFRLEKNLSDKTAAPPPRKEPPSSISWIMTIIVIAGIIVSSIGLFILWKEKVPFNTPEKDKASRPTIKETSEPVIKEKIEDSAIPAVEAETTDKSENKNAALQDHPADPDKALAKDTTPGSLSFHWHIPYSKESEMEQLVNTIKILEIKPDHEDNNFLVFKATGRQVKLLIDGIQFTNKLELDLPDFVLEGNVPDSEIPVSIFFMDQTSLTTATPAVPVIEENGVFVSHEPTILLNENILDWHIFIVPSQRDALLNVIRQGGGKIIYASKEVAIFSISGTKISQLTEDIQGTGGVFANFGNTELDEGSLTNEIERVLIYFQEQ